MGEGAAALVLENGETARARGARILAILRGYGATSDAFHITAPPANGEAPRARSSGRWPTRGEPDELVYVNAHGTSTRSTMQPRRAR